VPVEFLTDEQAEAYGTFTEVPTRPELERFFFLDDDDRDLIALRRTDAHRLGMAVQICTVRYIGCFLGEDPLAVPWEVVEYLAGQLGIADASCVKRYPERRRTPYEHAHPRTAGRRRYAPAMSDQTTPPILLELGGIEDFETAMAMLRATGARRGSQNTRSRRIDSGNSRTFVIDHDITAQQAAALFEFIQYGTSEGFLKVEINAPELDYDGAEEWWETA
jgi:hypothetical protein